MMLFTEITKRFIQLFIDSSGRCHSPRSGIFLGLLAGLTVGCSLFASTPATAQQSGASNVMLEEIVVTARRREESLQDTPVSASVLSAVDIKRLNMLNLNDMDNAMPNVSLTTPNIGGSQSVTNIYIRGVGQFDNIISTDPGVGMYVDGVYLARAFGNNMDLLELERVEVLRGPQGTLFGKNTIGGAINVISKKPADEFGGWGEVTYGRYDRLEFQGSVDVPLSPTLKTKFSLSKKDQDGYGERLDTDEEQGETDHLSGRAQLLWTPRDDFSVYVVFDAANEDEQTIDGVLQDADSTAFAPFLANAIIRPDLPPIETFVTTSRYDSYAENGSSDLEAWGISATMEWKINDQLTAKSITAYRDSEHVYGGDNDGSPLPLFDIVFGSEQDQFSQEVQLLGESFDGKLNWIAGAYYFTEDGESRDAVGLIPGLYTALEALPFAIPGLGIGGAGNPANLAFDISLDLFNTMDVESVAVFGQGTYALTDQLSITAGVRYTDESKEYFFDSTFPESGTVSVPPTTLKDDWDDVSFRAGLEYKWNEDLMTYFSVATGFKSGGYNGRPLQPLELTSFDPEDVLSYEIGVKSIWWDRRLRLNAAVFYTDYNDLQLQSFQDSAVGFVSVVENAGEAEILGAELELTLLPAEGWLLTFGAGYLDDDIRELGPLVQSVTTDSDLPHTPDWNLNGSIEHRHQLPRWGSLVFGGNWTYTDDYTINPTTNPLEAVPGYHLFGARVSFITSDERWELSLWGTNLADKEYLISRDVISPFTGIDYVRYGRPREWGLSLRARF